MGEDARRSTDQWTAERKWLASRGKMPRVAGRLVGSDGLRNSLGQSG